MLAASALAVLPDAAGVLTVCRAADGAIEDFVWRFANPAAERLFAVGRLAGRRVSAQGADAGCLDLPALLAEALVQGTRVERMLSSPHGCRRVAAVALGGAVADQVCVTVLDLGSVDTACIVRLRLALEHSSESIALFDVEDRLLECNARFRALLPEIADVVRPGIAFETILNAYFARDPRAPVSHDGRAAVLARRLERHRGGGPPFTFRTPSGRWLLASERRTPDGGTLCVYTDVSALKEKERRLRASEAEANAAKLAAERADRAKTEFLAHMSHELRTPLNAVLGFTELMLSERLGPLGSPRYRDYAQDIREGGLHLLNLIDDLLELTLIEAGRRVLAEVPTDPGDAMRKIAREVGPDALAREVRVEIDVEPDLEILFADARALDQMLLNLVSNAVKFTPAGGEVMLSVRRLPDGGIGFMVADTGIGIAAEELPRLAEPFARADGYKASPSQGTGLGLGIVKRLVELHGGRLELDSELGMGTTAILLFPATRSVPRMLAPPPMALRRA